MLNLVFSIFKNCPTVDVTQEFIELLRCIRRGVSIVPTITRARMRFQPFGGFVLKGKP
jgi:hypothetical protein